MDTFAASQCASGSASEWQWVEIFFEQVLEFCDRFVVSGHGRVLPMPVFTCLITQHSATVPHSGSKHS